MTPPLKLVQEQLKHLGNYHGAISASEAEKLLKTADGPAWMTRYSDVDRQVVVSAKDDAGKIAHSLTLTIDGDKQKSATVEELAKSYKDRSQPLTAKVKGSSDLKTPVEQDALLQPRYEKNLAAINGLLQTFEEDSTQGNPQGVEQALGFKAEKNKAVELANAGRYADAIKKLQYVQALIENVGKHSEWKGEFSLKSAPGDIPHLNDFKVGQLLGKGGYGAVFRLESEGGPPLVFKKPRVADPTKKQEALDSYNLEAKMYEKIGPHPNIARCLGMCKVGDDEGLALEAINGGTVGAGMKALQRKVDAGVMSHEDLLGVRQYTLQKTLQTLAYIHSQGVIHADIKPENLMFDDQNERHQAGRFWISSHRQT